MNGTVTTLSMDLMDEYQGFPTANIFGTRYLIRNETRLLSLPWRRLNYLQEN